MGAQTSEQVLRRRWCAGVRIVVSDGLEAIPGPSTATWVTDARAGPFPRAAGSPPGFGAPRRAAPTTRRDSAFDPLFRARFLLLRRPDRLDDAQRAQLEAIFETHPRLRDAWDALSELHGLYLADDQAGALAALDRFTDLYQTGDLPEFHKIVNTLLAHMPRFAWHAAGRPSNGRIEGTNNLLQVCRTDGFTNPDNSAACACRPPREHHTDTSNPKSHVLGRLKKVLRAYERRLEVEVAHPEFGYRITYRRVIEVQARFGGMRMPPSIGPDSSERGCDGSTAFSSWVRHL